MPAKKPTRLQPVPTIDLRGITRDVKLCRTVVKLYWGWDQASGESVEFDWILAGESQIRTDRRIDFITLDARMDVTDREHDSAYAFKLPIIGLHFDHVWYHTSHFTAWINPNGAEDFNVPNPGYNPKKDPKAYKCEECKGKESHYIVPHFVPTNNLELFKRVSGKKIEIQIGPVIKAIK